MIKARLSDGTLILGLSAENLKRLQQGKPILFDGHQLGYPGKIAIVYGETEDAIAKDLLRETGSPSSDGDVGMLSSKS